MKILSPASPRKDGRPDGATPLAPRVGLRVLIVTAAALLVVVVRPGPSSPACAGDQGPAQEKSQGVVARYERTLGGFDRRLIALTKLVLEDAASAQGMQDQVMNFRIQAQGAESAYLNAQLTRQVAEIALREYAEATVVQDRASVEGEIKTAQDSVERSKRETAEAKERLARITAVADNSAFGLNMVYSYTDRLAAAERQEKTAEFTLKLAESKKNVLIEFTIAKRKKELESEVAKARSDELAKQATWELRKGMIVAAQKQSEGKDLPDDRKRILALIDQAIPLEEQIRARLVEVSKSEQPLAQVADIDRWMQDLTALVDRAESLRDTGDFARLKPQIQRAARRYKVSVAK